MRQAFFARALHQAFAAGKKSSYIALAPTPLRDPPSCIDHLRRENRGAKFMEQFIAFGDSSHTWLGIFASRLLELRPTASVASSVRCAVSTFHDSRNLDPRKAADRYSAARGNARQVAAKREPASLRYEARFRDG